MSNITFSGEVKEKETLLSVIREKGAQKNAPCGGNGTCWKCVVRFLSKAPEPTETEKMRFSEEELLKGYRLACRCRVSGSFEVTWESAEDETCYESGEMEFRRNESFAGDKKVAIDLGTTTLAAAFLVNGEVKDVKTAVNHQRRYGADVISRIKAANQGNGKELQRLIHNDIRRLISSFPCNVDEVPVFLSGNTTMGHLYSGLSCKTLGESPFHSEHLSLRTEGNVTILPGISVFAGADIVSGIVSLEMDRSEKLSLLLDLGTNGEMALGNRDRLFVASTAAGPALEGGNLSCGCAGVPGAITGVTIKKGKASVRTMEDLSPIGLCGSGVIEAVYELFTEELMDETGLLKSLYFENGFPVADGIFLTAADIREIQLAKAAVRAGLETLIRAYGVSYNDIDTLYLSGGFGQALSPLKASGIGLIPPELVKKTKVLSNTSLSGAILFAIDESVRDRFSALKDFAQEIVLADSSDFQELFIKYMNF